MTARNPAPISFTSDCGDAVTVPADKARIYAQIKAAQVAALSRLVSDYTAGFDINLTENDLATFTGLISELAHAANKVVGTLLCDDIPAPVVLSAESSKGGA